MMRYTVIIERGEPNYGTFASDIPAAGRWLIPVKRLNTVFARRLNFTSKGCAGRSANPTADE